MSEIASTMNDPASLTPRVARGAAWIMGAGLIARALGAINTIVVARLLVPDDIGIVATATITMQLMQGISDIGVSQAVVRFRDAGRRDLDTLFTLSVMRGALIGLLLFAAAPLAAAFYGDPRMFWAFAGVALFPLMTGFINPRYYEFERELEFSKEFIVTIANRLAGVAASLMIAIFFRTYWAIICGLLASGCVQLVLSYALRPYRPHFGFHSFSKVFGFSGWLAGVGFLAALNNKLDVPLLTRFAGAGGAGVYFLGLHLSELAPGQVAAPVTRALYPGLSQMQSDPARMRAAFLKGVEALGVFAMPAAFGLAFVAEDFTAVVLGENWRAVGPVIALLAPVVGLQSLFFATQAYATALGLTRLVFFRERAGFRLGGACPWACGRDCRRCGNGARSHRAQSRAVRPRRRRRRLGACMGRPPAHCCSCGHGGLVPDPSPPCGAAGRACAGLAAGGGRACRRGRLCGGALSVLARRGRS